jgi:hypothetical protein
LHRWYAPGTGRWLSEDPIGFAAGDANLYRYVGNGVTGATDPSGKIERVTKAEPRTTESGFFAQYSFELDRTYEFEVTVIQKITIDFEQWDLCNRNWHINPVSISYYEVVGTVPAGQVGVLHKGAMAIDTWQAQLNSELANSCEAKVRMEGQVRAFRTEDIGNIIKTWKPKLEFPGRGLSGDKPHFPWLSGEFPANTHFGKANWTKNVVEAETMPMNGKQSQRTNAFNRIWAIRKCKTGKWEFKESPGQQPVKMSTWKNGIDK